MFVWDVLHEIRLGRVMPFHHDDVSPVRGERLIVVNRDWRVAGASREDPDRVVYRVRAAK